MLNRRTMIKSVAAGAALASASRAAQEVPLETATGDQPVGKDDSAEDENAVPQPPGPPKKGMLYHGVHASTEENEPPAGATCDAVYVNRDSIDAYLDAALPYVAEAKRATSWVLFLNDWSKPECRSFPRETCDLIWNGNPASNAEDGHHTIPFIYLLTQSHDRSYEPDPIFHLQSIIDGCHDRLIRAWARGARDFGKPLMVAWGKECNGYWQSWNGMFNGLHKKTGNVCLYQATHSFQKAYEHIIKLCYCEGADNITWGLSVVAADNPNTSDKTKWPKGDWNAFEDYFYDDWMQFISVSVYATHLDGHATEPEITPFAEQFEDFYTRVKTMKLKKQMKSDTPIYVGEFGCTARVKDLASDTQAAEWAGKALDDLFAGKKSGKYPDLGGFSWWNEGWSNSGNGQDPPDSELRLQKVPKLAATFADRLQKNQDRIQTTFSPAQ